MSYKLKCGWLVHEQIICLKQTTVQTLQAQKQVDHRLNREFPRADSVAFAWPLVPRSHLLPVHANVPFGLIRYEMPKNNRYGSLQATAKYCRQTVTPSGNIVKWQHCYWGCSNNIPTLGVAFTPHIWPHRQQKSTKKNALPTADSVAIFVAKINNASETR